LFEGRRELFGAIAGLDWKWRKHPVIRIDLNPANYATRTEHLNTRLRSVLAEQFYHLIKDIAEQAG
jgi:hypothetical protein